VASFWILHYGKDIVDVAIRVYGRDMCRIEGEMEERERRRRRWGLGLKGTALGDSRVEKLKSCIVFPRSRVKLWIIRATTMVLLWTCLVQLTTLGELLGPSGWPCCFPHESAASFLVKSLPPKSEQFCFFPF